MLRTRTFLTVTVSLLLVGASLCAVGLVSGVWPPLFVWAALAVLLLGVSLAWGFGPVIFYYVRIRGEEPKAVEATFVDPIGNEKRPFPSLLHEGDGVSLSVVVPSFNEEKRLPRMLDETIAYLEQRRSRDPAFTWEIIVVDDGSRDRTVEVGLEYAKTYSTDRVRVLKLARNHGKGGAVMKGMLRGRGKMLLMVDADGATRFADVESLEQSMQRLMASPMKPQGGVVVGSRHHMQEADAEHKRGGMRGFVSFVFHILQTALVPGGIRDTQCGFKLFSREAARAIFPRQKMWGWSFDVDLIFLAHVHGFPVAECAVYWVDVPGSKLSIVLASLEMARDLVLLKVMYGLGVWG